MEEEEVGKGEEATVIGQAVLIRPKVREGLMEAAGMGILITTAHLAARCPACSIKEEGSRVMLGEGTTTVEEGWEAIVMSKATMCSLDSTIRRDRACRKARGGTTATETRGPEISNVSEVGTALHRWAWEVCRRVMAVEGCTAEGSTAEGSTAEGSAAVAVMAVVVMAIHITTIKVAARRIMEEGSTVEGSTVKGEG